MKTCLATIRHGPGHQSETHCQVKGNHMIHKAVYGSAKQEATWYGRKAFSDVFDMPPKFTPKSTK